MFKISFLGREASVQPGLKNSRLDEQLNNIRVWQEAITELSTMSWHVLTEANKCLTTHPADPASIAVELLFVLVIIQLALVAEILHIELIITTMPWQGWSYLPEHSMAPRTGLLHGLPQPTLAALNLHHVVPLEGVVLLLVVAEPAPVQRVAARSLKFKIVTS